MILLGQPVLILVANAVWTHPLFCEFRKISFFIDNNADYVSILSSWILKILNYFFPWYLFFVYCPALYLLPSSGVLENGSLARTSTPCPPPVCSLLKVATVHSCPILYFGTQDFSKKCQNLLSVMYLLEFLTLILTSSTVSGITIRLLGPWIRWSDIKNIK